MLLALLVVIIAVQAVALIVLVRKLKNVNYDGVVRVHEDDGTKTFSFEPDGDLYDLDERKEVRLKVELTSAGDRA